MRPRNACHAGDFWRPYFLYVGLSALYALFAAGIVAFWAPEAAGSGMPEIKVSAPVMQGQVDRTTASITTAVGCCAVQAMRCHAILAVCSGGVILRDKPWGITEGMLVRQCRQG